MCSCLLSIVLGFFLWHLIIRSFGRMLLPELYLESNVLGKRFKIFLLISILNLSQNFRIRNFNSKVCLKTHNLSNVSLGE